MPTQRRQWCASTALRGTLAGARQNGVKTGGDALAQVYCMWKCLMLQNPSYFTSSEPANAGLKLIGPTLVWLLRNGLKFQHQPLILAAW